MKRQFARTLLVFDEFRKRKVRWHLSDTDAYLVEQGLLALVKNPDFSTHGPKLTVLIGVLHGSLPDRVEAARRQQRPQPSAPPPADHVLPGEVAADVRQRWDAVETDAFPENSKEV